MLAPFIVTNFGYHSLNDTDFLIFRTCFELPSREFRSTPFNCFCSVFSEWEREGLCPFAFCCLVTLLASPPLDAGVVVVVVVEEGSCVGVLGFCGCAMV